ncbi:MAG: NAD-dependent epimerase/dehydratase family protein [Actinomycetes bacterium]|nr:MAG: NAD-dependent dehydratase [Actinomycetota bacterium]
MRILVVGGTGLISSEFARVAVERGDEVTLITRGTSPHPALAGTRALHADATDASALRGALHGARLRRERWDAVVQFIAYTPDHVTADLETFAPLADRYVLVATAAGYASFERHHPLTEDTRQENLHWQYARDKIACEEVLRSYTGPMAWTIVRPAHTYGRPRIPGYTGNSRRPWTLVDRMRRGADIVLPGDGTAVWTITHAADVAAGMRGLLDTAESVGLAVHITSDEALTWRGLHREIARAAGLSDEQFDAQVVCVPSDALVAAAPSQAGSIYGDKMHNAVYDTSLIKRLVPGWSAQVRFAEGVRDAIAWFEEDPARQVVDAEANAMFDRIAAIYRRALDEAAS